MKHKNTDSDAPHNWRELVIFSLVFSLTSIAVASIALEIPFTEVSREVAYNKTMTLAGIIVGVFGVAATVYFVVMGIDIHRYKREIDDIVRNQKNTNAKIDENKFDIIDSLSMMEGLFDDKRKKESIRLAMGRIICKSKIYTEKFPLETGISYLGQYSSSQKDIDILQVIEKESDDEKIRNQAKSARKEIEKRRENTHGQEDIDILQVIEKESDDEKNRNQAKKAREEIGKRSKRRR